MNATKHQVTFVSHTPEYIEQVFHMKTITPSMLFRFHAGSLYESMKSQESYVTFDQWKQAVMDFYYPLPPQQFDKCNIESVFQCYDERIKQMSYRISIKNWGVIGFSNKDPRLLP